MTTRAKAVAALVGVAVVAAVAAPYVRTAAALLDLVGTAPGVRRWLPVAQRPFGARDTLSPTRYGPIAIRVYAPPEDVPTVIVFPGIHGGGTEAPRLVRFCSSLASTGVRVICAPLPDLREFRVTSRSTDMIEDVAVWATSPQGVAPGQRVAVVGVSFAGGLALVAAGRPTLAGKLSAVVVVGGHGDLARTLTYLTTGVRPDGRVLAPHDYGLAIAALAAAPHLLRPPALHIFQRAVRTFLEASVDESPNQARAAALVRETIAIAAALPPNERRLIEAITSRDTQTVGRWVQPAVPLLAADPGLSPSLSPLPSVPVFLMHGRDDNVIPSTEAGLVFELLRARGHRSVHTLVTPLISHAELGGRFAWAEGWRFLRFWHRVRQTINGATAIAGDEAADSPPRPVASNPAPLQR